MTKRVKQEEVINVIRWMAENPYETESIIDTENIKEPEIYMNIIKKLEKDSMEYLIPMVMYAGRFNMTMSNVSNRILANGLIYKCKEVGSSKLLKEIKKIYNEG